MSHPGANSITPNQATPANTNPLNNALVAAGTIRLPAGGEIKAVGYQTQENESPATALEQQYLDQRCENSCYLVAIQNDVQADAQNIQLGFVVTDYYKVVV